MTQSRGFKYDPQLGTLARLDAFVPDRSSRRPHRQIINSIPNHLLHLFSLFSLQISVCIRPDATSVLRWRSPTLFCLRPPVRHLQRANRRRRRRASSSRSSARPRRPPSSSTAAATASTTSTCRLSFGRHQHHDARDRHLPQRRARAVALATSASPLPPLLPRSLPRLYTDNDKSSTTTATARR